MSPRSYREDRDRMQRSIGRRTGPAQSLSPSPASRRPRSITPTTDMTGVIRYMQSNAMSRRNVPSMPILPPWNEEE